MILNEKTETDFGYMFEDLSNGSSKKVWLNCDYCEEDYISSPKRRNISNKDLDKDGCKKCRYLKRDEIGKKSV